MGGGNLAEKASTVSDSEHTKQVCVSWVPEILISETDRKIYASAELYPKTSFSEDVESKEFLVKDLHFEKHTSDLGVYSFCVSINEIVGFLISWPSYTKKYGSLILNLLNGASLGPLWFHDEESVSRLFGVSSEWGGASFLKCVDKHCFLIRSKDNSNFFEISSKPELNPYLLDSDTEKFDERTSNSPLLHDNTTSLFTNASLNTRNHNDLKRNVLEKFSLITKALRGVTSSVLDHPAGKQISPYLPSSVKEFASYNPPDSNSSNGLTDPDSDYESARVYLAQWASQHILRQQQELNDLELSGMNNEQNIDNYGLHSLLLDDFSNEVSDLGDFDLIDNRGSSKIPVPLRTKAPLSPQKWTNYFYKNGVLNPDGKLECDKSEILKDIFSGGIDEDLRPVVWKFLLGIYPWDSTESERINIDKINADTYYTSKSEWLKNKDLIESLDFLEQKTRIEKDVLRTDRELPTFATDDMTGSDEQNIGANGLPGSNASLEHLKDILLTYHFTDLQEDDEGQKLGYVQGMSDLLSPLYVVMQDEASSYKCFVNFMKRMRRNFFRNQSGMTEQLSTLTDLIKIFNYPLYKHLDSAHSSNLFCCYRWLLIWFKREFQFDDILKLWEVLWTDYLTPDFFLLVAFGILQRHSDVIMDHLLRFDEVLKYVNGLSGGISLNVALKDAEILFYVLRNRLDLIDSKGVLKENNSDHPSQVNSLLPNTSSAGNIDNNISVGILVDLDDKKLMENDSPLSSLPESSNSHQKHSNTANETYSSKKNHCKNPNIPERIRSVFYP
ncbi:GTPase-activating protein gyp7 [Smittium culicis]|uniref:GTPase-activating protein gyp7 n=1 Tax=Smittium culicis TaxID=133412 RepID=A0A1R1XYJ7_9FUNG|nr:GTPase-activating protein gyp7 [Smittium culicis]